MKKSFLVDVPVKLNIWTRNDCQKSQFEIIKIARPSILFLQSDGGRNDLEWEKIYENRKYIESNIDWDCKVYKIYESTNQGLYEMNRKVQEFIWKYVDRCIFLEDDHIPSVSFFSFCSELLERYKDDLRIEMITGNNIFETYNKTDNDYFFSSTGWSIWGTATWKNRVITNTFPLPYANDKYVIRNLKKGLSAFWFDKVKKYTKGILADGHIPGPEYYHGISSALNHRVSIIPTKNLIKNVGLDGEHAKVKTKRNKYYKFYNTNIYEIDNPLKHPRYVIDDIRFGKEYSKKLGHSNSIVHLYLKKIQHAFKLLLRFKLIKTIIEKNKNTKTEK